MQQYTEPTKAEWRAFLERGQLPGPQANFDVVALQQMYPSITLQPSPHIAAEDDFFRVLRFAYGDAALNIRVRIGLLCTWWLERRQISPAASGEHVAYFRWTTLINGGGDGGVQLLTTIAGRGKLTQSDVGVLREILSTLQRPADWDVDNNVGAALEVRKAADMEKRRRFIHKLNVMREAVHEGGGRAGIVPDVDGNGKFEYPDLEEKISDLDASLQQVKERMADLNEDGVLWKGLESHARKLYHEREALKMERDQRERLYKLAVRARDELRQDPYFDDGFIPATLRPEDTRNLSVLWRLSVREAKKDMAVQSLESMFGPAYATANEQRAAVETIKKKRRTDEFHTGTYRAYYGVDESSAPVDPKDFGAQIPTSFGGSVLNKF